MKDEKTLQDELVEIFQSLPSELKPDSTNEFQHYSYNSIQQIKKVIGKELKKHNILFLPVLDSVENLLIGDKVLTTAHFIFTFAKGKDRMEFKSAGQAVDNQGKGLSKAKSDAVKRLFTDMFLIATSDEDDEKDYGKEPEHKNYYQNNQKDNSSYAIKDPDSPITEKQKKAIWAISKSKNIGEDALHLSIQGFYKKNSVSELTKAEASELIDRIQKEG